VTIPSAITGQFLSGDTIDYSCNGDLIPDAPTTLTCMDTGIMAEWLPDVTTTPLPTCSKYSLIFLNAANASIPFGRFGRPFKAW